MRKFIFIFVLLLILTAAGLLAYQFLFRIKRYEKGAGTVGDCSSLDPEAAEFGRIGGEISSKSGASVAGREFVISTTLCGKPTCAATTGGNGLMLFDKVPVGTYYVYQSKECQQTGGPHPLPIKVSKGITSEVGMLGE